MRGACKGDHMITVLACAHSLHHDPVGLLTSDHGHGEPSPSRVLRHHHQRCTGGADRDGAVVRRGAEDGRELPGVVHRG